MLSQSLLSTTLTFGLAALSSLFMAWVIGAGSSGATPFAPAVGARAISVMRSALVVGVLGFLGAVVQGAAVSGTVGEGLVAGVAFTPLAVVVALLTAAALMLVGIVTGVPIATAFTVTGAMVGIGLALGGTPVWTTYARIGALWVFTPVVGGSIAFALASLLPREDVPERYSVPLLVAAVGAVTANVRFTVLGPAGESRSLATALGAHLPVQAAVGGMAVSVATGLVVGALAARSIARDQRRGLNHVLLGLGALVAFSAGGSQVGLAVGPLLPLLDGTDVPVLAVLVGGGFGMLVGSWTGAPRMIKALSQDYSSLGPRRAISALVPSFLIAQTAVLLGVPVSFNEIVVSGIVGSGLAVTGAAGVSRGKLVRTVVAWAGSFGLAFVVGYGAFTLAGWTTAASVLLPV